MKKTSLLLIALMLCFCGYYKVYGLNIYEGVSDSEFEEGTEGYSSDTLDDEGKKQDDQKSLKEELQEVEENEENNDNITGLATLPNGTTAYVGASGTLDVRDGVWGKSVDSLGNNTQVTITGRQGDWYKVKFNVTSNYSGSESGSNVEGYVPARYIFNTPGQTYEGTDVANLANSTSEEEDVVLIVKGAGSSNIVECAREIEEKYRESGTFPYAPGTENGNLGCAQVATSVLCAAGVLEPTAESGGVPYASLGCVQTISLLEEKGWKEADCPPYQAGDVVFWETYLPGASHVGIVMDSGNTAQAMNNSSTNRAPHYSDIEAMKIYKIYRQS